MLKRFIFPLSLCLCILSISSVAYPWFLINFLFGEGKVLFCMGTVAGSDGKQAAVVSADQYGPTDKPEVLELQRVIGQGSDKEVWKYENKESGIKLTVTILPKEERLSSIVLDNYLQFEGKGGTTHITLFYDMERRIAVTEYGTPIFSCGTVKGFDIYDGLIPEKWLTDWKNSRAQTK